MAEDGDESPHDDDYEVSRAPYSVQQILLRLERKVNRLTTEMASLKKELEPIKHNYKVVSSLIIAALVAAVLGLVITHAPGAIH